ncbi:hypothetical protein BDA99DRAFT_544634 [Phascolomyces articulosus]|uniref:Uncharacterized protein n=1 Tax=Phascolomyces articulosus TaxID=60185 RepID=A0AAD5JK08_9FUNG|nr:hypothetical protein BDA99DRAFT_544634 [Phascolomyces articulosus]
MSYQYDNQYGNYLDNFDESDDFERHINDTEQQQPLTEETGQQVLELVQQLLSKNTTQEANNTTQTVNNLCETRYKKPRHRINGQDRIITNISNKHIDTALSTFFQINQDEIPNLFEHTLKNVYNNGICQQPLLGENYQEEFYIGQLRSMNRKLNKYCSYMCHYVKDRGLLIVVYALDGTT